MFQFTGFPSIRYGLAYGYMRASHVGFPIQKSPDHRIFAPPRSLSQLITSFIGSQCQGIRPALFFAWPFRYYSVNIWRLVGLLFLYFVAFATPRFVSISTFNVFLDVLYMQFSRYISMWVPNQGSHRKLFAPFSWLICFISHLNTKSLLCLNHW